MSARRYETLTTSYLVAAIISSLLYGKLGGFNWLALLLGLVAGIAAAVTYFYNAKDSSGVDEQLEEDTVQDEEALSITPEQQMAHRAPSETNLVEDLVIADFKTGIERHWSEDFDEPEQVSLWSRDPSVLSWNTLHIGRTARYYVEIYGQKHHLPRVPVSSHVQAQQVFLEEVEELVRRLGGTCEFELKVGGSLKIRPISPAKATDLEAKAEKAPFTLDILAEHEPDRVN